MFSSSKNRIFRRCYYWKKTEQSKENFDNNHTDLLKSEVQLNNNNSSKSRIV